MALVHAFKGYLNTYHGPSLLEVCSDCSSSHGPHACIHMFKGCLNAMAYLIGGIPRFGYIYIYPALRGRNCTGSRCTNVLSLRSECLCISALWGVPHHVSENFLSHFDPFLVVGFFVLPHRVTWLFLQLPHCNAVFLNFRFMHLKTHSVLCWFPVCDFYSLF